MQKKYGKVHLSTKTALSKLVLFLNNNKLQYHLFILYSSFLNAFALFSFISEWEHTN